MYTQKTLGRLLNLIMSPHYAKLRHSKLSVAFNLAMKNYELSYKLLEESYIKKAEEVNNHSIDYKVFYYCSALKSYTDRETMTDKEWYTYNIYRIAAHQHSLTAAIELHEKSDKNSFTLQEDPALIELQFDLLEYIKRESIRFSGEGEIAKEIFTHLKTNRTVKEISIGKTENPNERIDNVLDLLESNSSIESLDIHFSGKINDTKPLERFFKSLTDNMNINHLWITFDDFTGIDLAYVAEMIKSSKFINSFVITVGDFVIDTNNLELLTSAIEKNMHLFYMSLATYAYNDENPSDYELEFDKFDDNIRKIVKRNKNFVKQVAKFLVQKFVMGGEFSLGEEIKYLKHYQAADKKYQAGDKKLLKEYMIEEIGSGKIDPSKIELVSDTNIQKYIAENFLKLSMVTKGTHLDELSFEQVSTTDDELSLEQVSGNSKKRKISDNASGPSKVRKLESSSITSQEKTYLSEEIIAEIASFLGPKNLWYVDTSIIPGQLHEIYNHQITLS